MGVWTALSLVDVESIGAGGGSLGWIDARGMLRVGPRSAGAVPGPACYGRGGRDATVTDALVVLGFIDPDRFLGGDFTLDAGAARDACGRLGEPLGMDAEEAAWGMRQIALAGMIKATRSRLAALGLDPREHQILSFGGSGSLFTPEIARALGVPRVIVPQLASVLSALRRGHHRRAARAGPLRARRPCPWTPSLVQKLLDELAAGVDDDLAADGVAPDDRSLRFEGDLRFSKQVYELQLPVSTIRIDEAAVERLLHDFQGEYAKRYGKGSIVLGTPVELVSLRAIGIGATVRATLGTDVGRGPLGRQGRRGRRGLGGNGGWAAARAAGGTRTVRLERHEHPSEVAVHGGPDLRPGHALDGPALVDGSDTTIWVPPGCSALVDGLGTLAMEVR